MYSNLIAAVHINMSTVQVRFALEWIVFAWVLFLGNPYE